jgi:hypothetical protein
VASVAVGVAARWVAAARGVAAVRRTAGLARLGEGMESAMVVVWGVAMAALAVVALAQGKRVPARQVVEGTVPLAVR